MNTQESTTYEVLNILIDQYHINHYEPLSRLVLSFVENPDTATLANIQKTFERNFKSLQFVMNEITSYLQGEYSNATEGEIIKLKDEILGYHDALEFEMQMIKDTIEDQLIELAHLAVQENMITT